MIPSAASTTEALMSTAPTISDCTWPLPSPPRKATKKRANTASPMTPSTAAAVRKTRSGAYIA